MNDLGKHNLMYAVWAEADTIPEIPRFDCVARFTYLQDALDYMTHAGQCGVPVIVTGPYQLTVRYPHL